MNEPADIPPDDQSRPDQLVTLVGRPVELPEFPFTVINPGKMPALLAAFADAQGAYAAIVRDKLVTQKLKDKDTGAFTGQVIGFYYADMAKILAAVIPALSARGVSFLQPLHQGADGSCWLYTIVAHKDGCMLITKVKLAESKDIKAFGTQITYLRRYMAGPALGVSAEDDAENDGTGAGDGDAEWEERNRSPAPAPRAAPARRSASAPAAATGAAATPAGSDGINQGELANIQKKIKAAGLDPAAVDDLLAKLGIPAVGLSMSKAHWTALKHAVESL